jgi:biofilm protein TabA
MLYGKLDALDTYAPFLKHSVWDEALNWLRAITPGIVPGIHQLRGDNMYANVHGYETKERVACRYESHRRYVDLQYCISGGEIIEWHPLARLEAIDGYDAKKDVIHFRAPVVPEGTMRMSPGAFAVFFPSDGHMPKIADGLHPRVDKLVIKIALELFN